MGITGPARRAFSAGWSGTAYSENACRRPQCAVFGRDQSVIARHIGNVFKEGELESESAYAEFAYTASDGKTYQVGYYNPEPFYDENRRMIGFCIMSNHFHVYAYVPSDRALTDEEIHARICTLYRGMRLEELLNEWDMLKAEDERLRAQPGGKPCASEFDEFKLSSLSAAEIGESIGMKSRHHLITGYLQPLQEMNLIAQTIPNSPKSPNQRYKAA